MLVDSPNVLIEKFCHLLLGKPDSISLQADVNKGGPVSGLINDYLITHALIHWEIMGLMMFIFCNCPLFLYNSSYYERPIPFPLSSDISYFTFLLFALNKSTLSLFVQTRLKIGKHSASLLRRSKVNDRPRKIFPGRPRKIFPYISYELCTRMK
jgi:hypothetical protein